MSDAAAAQVGRYRIVAELGRGAMGIVYKAEDPLLNRSVAIKTILLSPDATQRIEYEARFYQEAKAAGGLNHRNIVTIYDIGREGDIAFMAMELIDGVELRELMQQRRLSFPEALDIAAQVADGLAAAHRQGVVHRDIKPANVMIVGGQQAKIMDFGIARVRLPEVKTQTGMLLGSPKYMSPEQVTGLAIDHRSDIFSLGLVLYEMVTGVSPFASATDVGQLMFQITRTKQRAPSAIDPAVPTMLDLIVARALEKDPDTRYQDAGELAADLRACKGELASVVVAPPVIALPAHDDATLRVAAATTVRIDPMQDSAFLDVGDGTNTTRPGAIASTDDTVMRLAVSRRFDSSEALKRLAALSAGVQRSDAYAGGTSSARLDESSMQGQVKVPGRRFSLRYWMLAAALSGACVAAVLIAIY